jgi:hypothetical protein
MTINLKIGNRLLYVSTIVLLLIAGFRLLEHRITNTFFRQDAVKDEVGFYNNFELYLKEGWYASVESGVSPLYNLCTRLLYFYNGDILLSLRLVGLISLVGVIIAWSYFAYYILNIRGAIFGIVLLFFVTVGFSQRAYFCGTSDGLFIFFMSLSIIFLFTAVHSEVKKYKLFFFSGVFFAFGLSTRELVILYSLSYFSIFAFLFFRNQYFWKSFFVWLVPFVFLVVIIHYPALKEKHQLSIHNKDFKDINVTWTEINYLTLLNNKDKLLYGRDTKSNKVTPEDILEYRKMHGQNALPKTFGSALFWDVSISLKNFLGLLYLSQLPFIFQLGLFYLLFIIKPIQQLIINRNLKQICNISNLPLFFFILYTIALCITPIRHIEFRWLMLFTFFISAFSISIFFKEFKKHPLVETIFYFNILAISTLYILLWGVF